MKLKRLRAGLYEFKSSNRPYKIVIEKMDEQAERYPGDLDYNMWRIYQYWPAHYEIWLKHHYTLADAKRAVKEELQL